MSIPVVRSPLWSKPQTDDSVPGTPGLAFLDAAQADVSVVWSRARDQAPSVYCPDAQVRGRTPHSLPLSLSLSHTHTHTHTLNADQPLCMY